MTVLSVANLDVTFDTAEGPVEAVRDLRFRLGARETLGIVGESGSGKSQSVLAIMGLLAENGRVEGSVRLDDEEILNRPPAELNRIRGRRIAMVFQDPMTSLNPHVTVGRQLARVLMEHRGRSYRDALKEVEQMLDAVRLPAAHRRLSSYPHEFSGGMRQRVMIAGALLCRPEVLIADEPTTALDVTVQASILALLRELRDAFGTALILITHDLGVVAGNCDYVIVMQDGERREEGTTEQIFAHPRDPYTRKLLAAVPRLDERTPLRPRLATGDAPALLEVRDLTVRFPLPRQKRLARREYFRAVEEADLTLSPGETLGIVGESGCGKSSLARALLQLLPGSTGRVALLGRSLDGLGRREMRATRRDLQLVFQDPLGSLDPRMSIERIVAEPLTVHERGLTRAARRDRVVAMLERVGLGPETLSRYPHELSGGQCQRAGIARALITAPRLVICDEAVSALDVSVQAGILDLLLSLQQDMGLSMLFIAHDLAVVRRVSHRVMVMYLGRVVERNLAGEIYSRPRHPYTRALLDAVPVPDPAVEKARQAPAAARDLPVPWDPPTGCHYRTRCPWAVARCEAEPPALDAFGSGEVACHRAGELDLEFRGRTVSGRADR
ncbi:MAG: oligopeptide ABC transporter ATP-binding protein OppD [Gammaproteobacteria bacterium]